MQQRRQSPSGGIALIVDDFDRDGLLDLAVAQPSPAGGEICDSCSVAVLRGNGDGTFGNVISYRVGQQPNALVAVDVNRDGVPDLVVANAAGSNVL